MPVCRRNSRRPTLRTISRSSRPRASNRAVPSRALGGSGRASCYFESGPLTSQANGIRALARIGELEPLVALLFDGSVRSCAARLVTRRGRSTGWPLTKWTWRKTTAGRRCARRYDRTARWDLSFGLRRLSCPPLLCHTGGCTARTASAAPASPEPIVQLKFDVDQSAAADQG
jgi:hypothetical protein